MYAFTIRLLLIMAFPAKMLRSKIGGRRLCEQKINEKQKLETGKEMGMERQQVQEEGIRKG